MNLIATSISLAIKHCDYEQFKRCAAIAELVAEHCHDEPIINDMLCACYLLEVPVAYITNDEILKNSGRVYNIVDAIEPSRSNAHQSLSVAMLLVDEPKEMLRELAKLEGANVNLRAKAWESVAWRYRGVEL